MIALDSGATHVTVNNSYLLASTIASIMPADEFIASENMKLNAHNKFMCAHGTVHAAEERCECKREDRLAPGSLIRSVSRLECPQCHTLCRASDEFCDSCDTSLLLPSPGESTGPVSLKEAASMLSKG